MYQSDAVSNFEVSFLHHRILPHSAVRVSSSDSGGPRSIRIFFFLEESFEYRKKLLAIPSSLTPLRFFNNYFILITLVSSLALR